MIIVEQEDGNLFELDHHEIASLSNNPTSAHPYRVHESLLNHREASVAAFALLSGLRSELTTTTDDAAFEHVLRWLERYSKGAANGT